MKIFCLIVIATYGIILTSIVEANTRQPRQVTIGFGLNPAAQQNLGGFLGGIFGRPQHQNHGRPPHNHHNGRPPHFNPFNIFNQGGGGGFNLQQAQSCSVNNGDCEQGCRERPRGATCFCKQGYVRNGDKKTCRDIDECTTLQSNCQGTCTNTEGSFECACPNGLVLLKDGVSCGAGETSCAQNNGGCEQICKDKPRGGVRCRCRKGFEINSNGRTCSDVDECASGTHNCVSPKVCHNNSGRFECLLEGQSNSCDVNNGGCEQRCRKNKRGIICACRRGFELQADLKTCVQPGGSPSPSPTGSCEVNNGGCAQRCRVNKKGIIKCGCRKNFSLQSDGQSCTKADISLPTDPCVGNNGGCDQICVNDNGQPKCECNQGFVFGNGFCQQIDPCQINNGGCDQICVNNNGFAVCECNQGLAFVDGFCQTLDPCQVNNGGCDQICVNNNGVVDCQCNPGFVFANGFCQHVIGLPSGPSGPSGPIVSTTQKPVPQKPDGCGVNTKKSLFRRIVGGRPANPSDWPWMAALLRVSSNKQFCGGALTTEQHIITAAHCVISFTKDSLLVRLGEYNFDSPDENNPTDFRVADIRMHQGYDQSTQENDIAIVKLSRPASFSEFIWPVCLPPPNINFEDQLGYVTGWGTIHFGGPVSNVLQEVVIPVWKQGDCVAAYQENQVTDSMMCAGLKAGGKDSCQGDSGGPFLVQIFPDSRWYLAGVVSWGIECASPNRPGVYTRVNKYLDWIEANTIF